MDGPSGCRWQTLLELVTLPSKWTPPTTLWNPKMTLYKDLSQGLIFGMALPLVAMPYWPSPNEAREAVDVGATCCPKSVVERFFIINATYGLHHANVFSFLLLLLWFLIVEQQSFKNYFPKINVKNPFFGKSNSFSSRWALFPLSWHKHRLRAAIPVTFSVFDWQWSRPIKRHDRLVK